MKRFLRFGLPAVPALLLTGLASCIDEDYDLSDIDSTVQVKVNDLVLPAKIKDVCLDKMIDLDDSDPDAIIKVREVDGRRIYFLSKGGSFDANPMSLDKVYAPKPVYQEDTSVSVESSGEGGTSGSYYKDYQITRNTNEFTYRVGRDGNPKVDASIVSISDVTIDSQSPMRVMMTVRSNALASKAARIELRNLDLELPAGMVATYGSITSSDGHLTIPSVAADGGAVSITLNVRKLDFTSASGAQGIDVVDGMFDYSCEIGFRSGTMRIYPQPGVSLSDLADNVDYFTHYDLTAFSVSHISGVIDYDLDFNGIAPIDLGDIPEFLSGGETNITTPDAALLLKVNNPVASYGLKCSTGLTLTPERAADMGTPDVLQSLTIGNDAVDQFHVLASSADALKYVTAPEGLPARYTEYTGLETLLAGDGLPSRIHVDFTSRDYPRPEVSGTVRDFPLGCDIPTVHGEYTFETPLAFASGSRVVYSHTNDGWNDEDIDAIEISKISVQATISSNIPAAAKVYVRPLDTAGERIPLTNADEAFALLPAGASGYPVTLELLGDIRHLDGLYIEAVIDDFTGEALSPDMTIKITDLKAAVTGTYTKEL